MNEMFNKNRFEILIMMKFNKENTYKFTYTRNDKKNNRNFWMILRDKIQLLKSIFVNYHFEIIEKQDLKVLKLREVLLFKLFDYKERLKYEL